MKEIISAKPQEIMKGKENQENGTLYYDGLDVNMPYDHIIQPFIFYPYSKEDCGMFRSINNIEPYSGLVHSTFMASITATKDFDNGFNMSKYKSAINSTYTITRGLGDMYGEYIKSIVAYNMTSIFSAGIIDSLKKHSIDSEKVSELYEHAISFWLRDDYMIDNNTLTTAQKLLELDTNDPEFSVKFSQIVTSFTAWVPHMTSQLLTERMTLFLNQVFALGIIDYKSFIKIAQEPGIDVNANPADCFAIALIILEDDLRKIADIAEMAAVGAMHKLTEDVEYIKSLNLKCLSIDEKCKLKYKKCSDDFDANLLI